MSKKKRKTDNVIVDRFVEEIIKTLKITEETESTRGTLKSLINSKIKYGKFIIT